VSSSQVNECQMFREQPEQITDDRNAVNLHHGLLFRIGTPPEYYRIDNTTGMWKECALKPADLYVTRGRLLEFRDDIRFSEWPRSI